MVNTGFLEMESEISTGPPQYLSRITLHNRLIPSRG
uniref:Uncharacterized protein n=1 Tax=Siphoviridae sp. ct2u94 TaxID=2826277 RepID=A0A8S5QVY8_9CAUD|nr:MAG TPA: hypothetical protein [Siphoviridae sp. ct2u94]